MIARLRSIGRRVRRDRRGATLVEFGFVILPLSITLLVLFDFGYRMYAQAVLEGTLHRAARLATIGDKTQSQIDDFVTRQLVVFTATTPPEIVKKSYLQFSGVNKAEDYDDDPANPNGKYDPGQDCVYDENNNNRRDSATESGAAGLGGSDDIVFYTVTLRFPRIVPLGRFLGWSNEESVTANTILRNQPYGSQAQRAPCKVL